MVVTHSAAQTRFTLALAFLAGGIALALWAAPVQGQAVISNGVIELGVNLEGDLIVGTLPAPHRAIPGEFSDQSFGLPIVGIRYIPTGGDGTATACACEAWGVSYDNSVTGFSRGPRAEPGAGLVPLPMVSTATTAISTVIVGDLTVVHDYHPSVTPNLYQATVTITNTGTAPHTDLRYRRAMDWDIAVVCSGMTCGPSEYSTIGGVCPVPPDLEYSSDNGFASGDPLAPRQAPVPVPTGLDASPIVSLGPPDCTNYFTDTGPADHGAMFDFNFGTIAPGGVEVFNIYYGAAANEPQAMAALGAVKATLWSLGQDPINPVGGTPHTFIFGFDVPAPVPPPEPPIQVPPVCSSATTNAMNGDLVELFAGASKPAGWYTATFMDGAMRREAMQTGWDVQHDPSNAWGNGVWVVTASGQTANFLPGLPTNSPDPFTAAAANAGAANTFYWPGGVMSIQHRDNLYVGNLDGFPSPTWRICPGTQPPPVAPPPPPAPHPAPTCSPQTTTISMQTAMTWSANPGDGPYTWRSPGGNPVDSGSSNPADTHTTQYAVPGTYSIKVTSAGGAATCTVVVRRDPGPTAAFSSADNSPDCGPRTISFQDASTTPNNAIIGWFWEFGDGATSRDQSPTHDYAGPGWYTVRLTVTDNKGGSSTATSRIYIVPEDCEVTQQKPQGSQRREDRVRDGFDADLSEDDTDDDGTGDAVDNCPSVGNDQDDLDRDGRGDACDPDIDGDSIPDLVDNCPETVNPDQVDLDRDAEGDACDLDADGDEVSDLEDNCLGLANDQLDTFGGNAGDACEEKTEQIDLAGPARSASAPDRAGLVLAAEEAPRLQGSATAGVTVFALAALLVAVMLTRRRR